MGRWLKATVKINYDGTGSKLNPDSTNDYINSGEVAEVYPDSLERAEKAHEEVEIESRKADTVFGVDKDGKRPFITIFDGHK